MGRRKKTLTKSLTKRTIVITLICALVMGGTYLIYKDKDFFVKKVKENELALKINTYTDLEYPDSEGVLNIENKKNNNYDVIVKIVLENEPGVTLYETRKLKPGEKIEKIKLDTELKKGSYKAIAYFYAYDEENKYKGKSGAKITINIKKEKGE